MDRQKNPEATAFTRLAIHRNRSMMAFNNAVSQRQAQPGTFADGLGREEWLKNTFQILGRYTHAGITDFNTNLIVALAKGADGDRAVVFNGVACS